MERILLSECRQDELDNAASVPSKKKPGDDLLQLRPNDRLRLHSYRATVTWARLFAEDIALLRALFVMSALGRSLETGHTWVSMYGTMCRILERSFTVEEGHRTVVQTLEAKPRPVSTLRCAFGL